VLRLASWLTFAAIGIVGARVPAEIRGIVRSQHGPVPCATVRVQTSGSSVLTNAAGEFVIEAQSAAKPLRVTAWAPGHYIGSTDIEPGTTPVVIDLRELPNEDNSAYEWLSPFASSGSKGSCQNCHSESQNDSKLPFDEWIRDAHSRSAADARFLSVYRGSDLSGRHQSPETRFAFVPDYGRVALRSDTSGPSYGPGYRLDFPGTGGNCAACHAPIAAMPSPYSTAIEKIDAQHSGITCDFCHKVAGVKLNPADALPHSNTPGVLAFSFRRPMAGEQIFLGPLDDVAPGDDTYSDLHKQSQFCAPCHFGQFWGVQVYNSFGEWLASPYSRAGRVQTCQDCHMPSHGAAYFVRRDKGGLLRNPQTVFSHKMLGPDDAAFMRSAARVDLTAVPESGKLRVTVVVTNSGAGHSLPTDYPGRNILLVVSASVNGAEVALDEGPRVPKWGGDLAGRPGQGFARVLEERWTREAPTIAYWRPTELESDSRIRAMESDSSTYVFRLPRSGRVHVTARLVYRRTYPSIARAKQWTDEDVLMQQKEMVISR
jgi:hypothetical protein